MTKSIQDYRNIVKILKLQLLKVRQQNNTLSHQLGIISETQNSSFTPKITKYKQSRQLFTQKILIFLDFAHRCELVGVTPEMVFRIADKQRDKKVNVKSLTEIMKRLKLRMSDEQIQKLLSLISKGSSNILYDDYLEYLSAFQINSQKYPQESTRTFIQLTLINFCSAIKTKYSNANDIYRKISAEQPYIQFTDLNNFCVKEKIDLRDIEIVAIFLGLDLQNECKIEKNIFKREIEKIMSLIEKGITDDRQNKPTRKENKEQKQITKTNKKEKMRRDEELEYEVDEQEGDQKYKERVKKLQKKQPVVQSKLDKGNVKIIQKELSKGLSVTAFVEQLLKNERKDIILRSFSLGDIFTAIKNLKSDFEKKNILKIFQILDKDANGCISTEELIKLWIRSDDVKKAKAKQILFKLLYRHLKQTQFTEPEMKFSNLGYKLTDPVTSKSIQQAFQQIQLSANEIQFITSMVGTCKIHQFAEKLKSEGKLKPKRIFTKMKKEDVTLMSNPLKKLNLKSNQAKFPKLKRVGEDNQDGEDDKTQKYWETIFTDPWACYDYCLNTASQLSTFWRDPQFGPTKNDPHGIKSIVGNQSSVPPGLPDEQGIQWLSYQEILQRLEDTKTQVTFMKKNLLSTDVVQGKLGDCWFVSALSIIANNDEYIKGKKIQLCKNNPQFLIQGIHPPLFHSFVKYGLFVFKFFKKFKPVYILVDELFPIETTSNELLFAKSPELDHQWVSFAEKAYAKLHHTYSSMISGDIAQGLNDLTNALPIKQGLNKQNYNPEDTVKSSDLEKIKRLTQQRQLMGCSITAPKGTGCEKPVMLDDEKCGLFYGHAYSIIDFLDLKTSDKNKFQLMRVRNPWGHSQWLLDWSDKPTTNEYKKYDKYKNDIAKHYEEKRQISKKVKVQALENYTANEDGQFLMNFKDWISIFTNLFTGISFKGINKYYGQYIIESWDAKAPSGICKLKGASEKDRKQFVKSNHQYILKVEETTDIFMLVIQEDGRLYRGEKYPYKQLVNAVLIMPFTLKGQSFLDKFDKDKMTFPENLKLQVRRDCSFWNKFEKGTYAIIPCKAANEIESSNFEFRIYSDKKIQIKKTKGQNRFQPLQQFDEKWDKGATQSIVDYLKVNNPKYDYPDDKGK